MMTCDGETRQHDLVSPETTVSSTTAAENLSSEVEKQNAVQVPNMAFKVNNLVVESPNSRNHSVVQNNGNGRFLAGIASGISFSTCASK